MSSDRPSICEADAWEGPVTFQLTAFGESHTLEGDEDGASSVSSSPQVAAAHLMTSLTDVSGMTVEALLNAHTQSLVMLAQDQHFEMPYATKGSASSPKRDRRPGSCEMVLPSLTLSKGHIVMDGVEAANVTFNVPEEDYKEALSGFTFGATSPEVQ